MPYTVDESSTGYATLTYDESVSRGSALGSCRDPNSLTRGAIGLPTSTTDVLTELRTPGGEPRQSAPISIGFRAKIPPRALAERKIFSTTSPRRRTVSVEGTGGYGIRPIQHAAHGRPASDRVQAALPRLRKSNRSTLTLPSRPPSGVMPTRVPVRRADDDHELVEPPRRDNFASAESNVFGVDDG